MEINGNSQPNKKMKKREEDEEDHLSDLPESLLFHILSFLPLESALRMSMLTRRWRALWLSAQAHALDLDFNIRYSKKKLWKYIDFVNQSLTFHQGSNIRKFRFTLRFKSMSESPIESWVDFAIKKKVQELDLCLIYENFQNNYKLPHSFYEHRSLTSLKLIGFDLELHRLKSFNFLRNLFLGSIKLQDGPFHELLAACPLLENLCIDSCYGLSRLCIPNSCLRLHHLRIYHRFLYNTELQIHAMNLLSLAVYGTIHSPDCIFKISSSAKEVFLHLELASGLRKSWSYHENISFPIFKDLTHDTEVLSLGSSCVKVASMLELQKFPTYFYKLKHLKLEIGHGVRKRCGRWRLHGIASLLRRSPQLETLIMDMRFPGYRYDEGIFKSGHSSNKNEYWESQESPFSCLVHNLKTINIYSHIASGLKRHKPYKCAPEIWENEMNVVKFFLKNALVLEKMTIQPMAIIAHDMAAEVLLEFHQKLEELPKASSHAQLLFL